MAEGSLGVFVDQLPCCDQMAGHGVGVGTVQRAELPPNVGRQLLGLDLARKRWFVAIIVGGAVLGMSSSSAVGAGRGGLGSRRSPLPPLRIVCAITGPAARRTTFATCSVVDH
jgi:hypothetical protein